MLRSRVGLALLAAGATGAAVLLAPVASAAHATSYDPHAVDPALRALAGADSGTFPGAEADLPELDARGPRLAPTETTRAAVAALGADVTASWTQYGTPRTLVRAGGGWLAEGLTGTQAEAARSWVVDHRDLFGLTDTSAAALETWRDTTLVESTAHAVLFRQHVGGRALAEDGLITVGIRDGKIAGVTSSAVPTALLGTSTAATPTLSAAQAVQMAARDAGVGTLALADLRVGAVDAAGFTQVAAKGLAQVQRTRLAALPTTDRGARLVWETDVEDVAAAHAHAAVSFVDATSGAILLRHDAVKTAAAGTATSASTRAVTLPAAAPGAVPAVRAATTPGSFSADYTPTACGAKVPLAVPAGTQTLVVGANGVVASNDFALNVFRGTVSIGSSDQATSPEAVAANVSPASTAGDTFSAQICPSAAPLGPFVAPYTVNGVFAASDQAVTVTTPGLPSLPLAGLVSAPSTFKFFQANPVLGFTTVGLPAADNRSTGCSTTSTDTTGSKSKAQCQLFFNTPATPDAYDTQNGVPTGATIGNNAATTNAQESTSLTPGAPGTAYLSATRDYAPAFADQWKTAQCNPATLVDPNRADVDTSITNLFTGHNRIHDFALRLGLNDATGSLQTSNATSAGVAGDPELGNAQNAAATDLALRQTSTLPGGTSLPVGLTGRNNANQITLQDGVPGITNQYLFEPVLGFYGPCADGDLDSSIFLHEYTHAISNRLIAGPATGLSGQQGGSMGESWSDLDAIEFLNAFGVAGKGGEDRYAEGAYATGDTVRGIRDYNLLDNPLTYGEFGFDTTGPEVHADGEVWNGIQMHVRQALIDAWRTRANPDDAALQKACALGVTTSGAAASGFAGCPGNRRWIQYVYDSLILQANGAPTFVDMKNTELMGAMLRGSSEDYATMADAFASRGLGGNSSAVDSADTDPVPGFASPSSANAHVSFSVVDEATGTAVPAGVYVGTYTARATPLASTVAGKQPATADMVGGNYSFAVQAAGYGIHRFTAAITAGQTTTQVFRIARNLASAASGATVVGDGSVRPGDLIDDSEATDTGYNTAPVAGKTWTVALGGGSHLVQRVNISAMHHPLDTAADVDFQSRITDLRAFDLQASNDGGRTYTTVYRSADDFFPGRKPRTTAPDVALRSFTLPAPVTADHVRLVVRTSQCTGSPSFAGDQDADPLNNADCPGSASAARVTVADLQVFAPAAVTAPVVGSTPGKPVAPATLARPTTALFGDVTAPGSLGRVVVRTATTKVSQPTRTLAFTGLDGALGAGALGLLGGLGVLLVGRRRMRVPPESGT